MTTRWSMRNPWALAAGFMILAVTTLIATQWALLPWFLDYFYHLAVVEGFRISGGLTLWDWWEFAPAGRPHLYPPLWHLLSLPLVEWGVPHIQVARLWCVGLFPLLALTLWRIMRRLVEDRAAVWAVILLSTPFNLTVAVLNYPAATLASVFTLAAWLAVERRRLLAASIAIGLIGYTHAGLFWLLVLSWILYAALRREIRREILLSLGAGLLIAGPWFIHQGLHLSALHLATRREVQFLEISPVLLGLAAWGLIRSWKPSGPGRFLCAWWGGTLPMALYYRFRLLTGHGLLPTVLLAGVGASDLWKRGRLWRASLLLLLILWPAWQRDSQGNRWSWANHTVLALSGWKNLSQGATQSSIFYSQFWEPIAQAIRRNTGPDDLFACNLDYSAGLLTVLSQRATTVGMLGEVAPASQDAIANAKILVWIKKDPAHRPPPPPALQRVVLQHQLQPLGETDLAYLYYNPRGQGRRQIKPAVLPWQTAILMIGLSIGTMLWDLRRQVPAVHPSTGSGRTAESTVSP